MGLIILINPMEIVIVLAVVGLCLFLYFKFFKIPKIKNIVFVDGTLGTGKSFFSVNVAVRLYKKAVLRWKFQRLFLKVVSPLARFKRFASLNGAADRLEEPLLFSNIPLRRVKFAPLTLDILLRKKRIPYKSVILIDEMSMVADQFDYKDRDVSDALRDFFKLYRHETHGGYIVINSQSTSDLHYSIKSVLSDYFYLHHKARLPFFSVIWAQEMAYSSDKDAQGVVNANNGDIEDNLKMLFVPNRYFKFYDTYCFSALTDGLPVFDDWYVLDKKASAKTKEVLTFRKGRYKVVSNIEKVSDQNKPEKEEKENHA